MDGWVNRSRQAWMDGKRLVIGRIDQMNEGLDEQLD